MNVDDTNELLRQHLDRAKAVQAHREATETDALHKVRDVLGPELGLSDLIKGDTISSRSDLVLEIEAMRKDSILDIYRRLVGREPAGAGGGDEVKVSCPRPSHPDRHPSASLNTAKNNWYCHACCVGGSVFDLAGAAWGYSFRGGKLDSAHLWEVKKRYAKYLHGLDYEAESAKRGEPTGSGEAPSDDAKRRPIVARSSPPRPPQSPGTKMRSTPTYKIHDVLPEGDNFLRSYFDATVQDETPDGYQLWCGLAALSVAVGRKVVIVEPNPVTASLGICLIGGTATGKSRSMRHVERLLMMDSRLQWRPGNELGVKLRENPASGPYLIGEFVDVDGSSGSPVAHPVKMLVVQDEISALVRKGNSRESNHGVREVVLQLLDGKPRLHHGSKTAGNSEALDGFAVLLGATQPEMIPLLFSNEDLVTGFMNRLLFIPGEPVKRSHRGIAQVDLTKAHRHLADIVSWAATGIAIDEWDDDADALWKEVFDQRVEPLQADPRWHKILGRLDLNMKRIIMLFAINERSSSIRLQHVQSAVALLDYLLECYQQLMQHMETTEMDRFWVSIMKACLKLQQMEEHEGHAPISQLQRTVGIRGWSASQYKQAVDAMSEAELVTRYTHTKRTGRQIDCFELTENGHAALR